MSIDSPYNFVPLSAWIYTPDWHSQVSHDLPFSDGISGEFEITIETESPLFIGGDHSDHIPKEISPFKATKRGPYAIPGTSIKGAIRNVLTIASYGKLSQVDDQFKSFRDLQHKDYRRQLTSRPRNGLYEAKSQGGYLRIVKKGAETHWVITKFDIARIEQADLISYHKSVCKGSTPNNSAHQIDNLYNKQNSVAKYGLWTAPLSIDFDIHPEIDHSHNGKTLRYRKAINLGSGNTSGEIVFTGQPATNDHTRGISQKHMEFIFYREQEEIEITDKVIKAFLQIHDTKENKEWPYWKQKLRKGERIPVFFLSRNTNTIDAFGLALMFRIPHANTTHNLINNTNPDHLSNDRTDLSEIIFGTTSIGEEKSMKGRVSFGLGISRDAQTGRQLTLILNTPKTSYYPNYIEQNHSFGMVDGQYSTFGTRGAKIRGWKRYPVHRGNNATQNHHANTDNEAIQVKITPIKPGATFISKVRVHNLRPVELGALVWAIQWGNDSNLKHSLGMGKPYGLGKCKITINPNTWNSLRCNKQSNELPPLDKIVHLYESHMDQQWKNAHRDNSPNLHWLDSEQLVLLKSMANPDKAHEFRGQLTYPTLNLSTNTNQFVTYIRNSKALTPYAPYSGKKDSELFSLQTLEELKKEQIKAQLREQSLKDQAKSETEKKRRDEEKKHHLKSLLEGRSEIGQKTMKTLFDKSKAQDTIIAEMKAHEKTSKETATEIAKAIKDYWNYIGSTTQTTPKPSKRQKNRIKEVSRILEEDKS